MNSTRGIKTVDISFSTNGGSSFENTLQDFTFAIADSGNYVGELKSLGATYDDVTHIKFGDLTTHGATDIVGFNEIRFVGTAAVPEPSTTALLGLSTLGFLTRRRR